MYLFDVILHVENLNKIPASCIFIFNDWIAKVCVPVAQLFPLQHIWRTVYILFLKVVL